MRAFHVVASILKYHRTGYKWEVRNGEKGSQRRTRITCLQFKDTPKCYPGKTLEKPASVSLALVPRPSSDCSGIFCGVASFTTKFEGIWPPIPSLAECQLSKLNYFP